MLNMFKLILRIFYGVNIPKRTIFGNFGDFQSEFEVNFLQVKIPKRTFFFVDFN